MQIRNPKSEIRNSSACGELNHEPVEWLPNRHRSSVYGELSRTVIGHRPAVSAVEPSSVLSPPFSACGERLDRARRGLSRAVIGAMALFCLLAGTPRVYGADYVIGSADVLFISVLGSTELDTVATVTPAGTISVPLVGDVQAAGLTAEELAGRLTRALAKKIRNPVVSVSLRQINSYRIYILGSVAKPGVVSSKSEITLLQALALTGGVVPGADLTLAYVARGNERLDVDIRKLLMEGDLSQNIVLKPEDVVVVPSNPRNEVFVMGEVNNPGTLQLNPESQLTVLKAVAQAGGFSQFAKPSGTVIIREEGGVKRIISVDVEEIMENPQEAKDVLLEPGDVVIVPQGGLF